MEKVLTVEEKIKRAEQIYNRRRGNTETNRMARVNVSSTKDFKLFKKMVWQIIICLSIYSCYYIVENNNYIFSKDFINKTQEILSYDIDFNKLYNSCMQYLQSLDNNKNEEKETVNESINLNNTNETQEVQNNNDENIGGAVEDINNNSTIVSEQNNENDTTNNNATENKEVSQMEKDSIDIKNSINFIKPVEGTISSSFGWRNPTTTTVPKYHTGLDIAAPTGTIVKSATDGVVSLSSSEGDYRKSLENNNTRCDNNLCTL